MYNTLTYIIYLATTFYITVVVGHQFFKYGRHYILSILKDDEITDSVNRMLLIGYYLLNIGYAFVMLNGWGFVENVQEIIEVLSRKVAVIIFILAGMHYFNLAVISIVGKKMKLKENRL